MSVTHVLNTPRTGPFRRAAHKFFHFISRKILSALDRVAANTRETPSEVFRFPIF